MQYIKDGGLLIAMIINTEDFPGGMYFWGADGSPLQFGSCVYDRGKVLQPHIHKVRSRMPEHKTIEFLYIIRGLVEAEFYSLDKQLLRKVLLQEGDCAMLYDGGHGFRILENETIFIEVKNGANVSVEADKDKFEA